MVKANESIAAVVKEDDSLTHLTAYAIGKIVRSDRYWTSDLVRGFQEALDIRLPDNVFQLADHINRSRNGGNNGNNGHGNNGNGRYNGKNGGYDPSLK